MTAIIQSSSKGYSPRRSGFCQQRHASCTSHRHHYGKAMWGTATVTSWLLSLLALAGRQHPIQMPAHLSPILPLHRASYSIRARMRRKGHYHPHWSHILMTGMTTTSTPLSSLQVSAHGSPTLPVRFSNPHPRRSWGGHLATGITQESPAPALASCAERYWRHHLRHILSPSSWVRRSAPQSHCADLFCGGAGQECLPCRHGPPLYFNIIASRSFWPVSTV